MIDEGRLRQITEQVDARRKNNLSSDLLRLELNAACNEVMELIAELRDVRADSDRVRKRWREKVAYIDAERRETVKEALAFADRHTNDMPVGSLAHVITSCWTAGMAQMARKLELMPEDEERESEATDDH